MSDLAHQKASQPASRSTNLTYQGRDWRYVFPTNKEKDIWALADHLFDHVTKCLCA